MLKREWGVETNGKLPHLFIPGKTKTWFLSLRWKICLRQNFSLGSCACSEGLALGPNTLMMKYTSTNRLRSPQKFTLLPCGFKIRQFLFFFYLSNCKQKLEQFLVHCPFMDVVFSVLQYRRFHSPVTTDLSQCSGLGWRVCRKGRDYFEDRLTFYCIKYARVKA